MKKIFILLFVWGIFPLFLFSQEKEKDTVVATQLSEIILIGKNQSVQEKQIKSLGSVDEYLQSGGKIDLVKRGSYAWEPFINNMATERTVVTIDGMRIFGACTDKMDPITSYVEISNLKEAQVNSGQQGACHGATIGGSLDLKRAQQPTEITGWKGLLQHGFESNNQQKINGGNLFYNHRLGYFNTNLMHRKADNYFAGGNREVAFSQFEKFNFSGTTGFFLKKNKIIEGSVIYDKATNVGYPALPMDVSLAEALITSLKYEVKSIGKINLWETKLYFNSITHKMDDTKRPNVPIHMDMPGWSNTYGMYSKINWVQNNHHLNAQLNSFYNQSVAEMTMYPKNPKEKLMFMYTWSDVRTAVTNVFLEDNLNLNCHSSIKISGSLSYHINHISSEFGLESNRIFYPDMESKQDRILKSVSAMYLHQIQNFTFNTGLGYGERAPSVSEAYGFYLFNSFDLFDYVGNPNLKNEKSAEIQVSLQYKTQKTNVKYSTNYFHISDYILGIPTTFLPMTIGASGVKQYIGVDYATIFTQSLHISQQLFNHLAWQTSFKYSIGKTSEELNLPFMSPLQYQTSLQFEKENWNANINLLGNGIQNRYSPYFGENKKPDYYILNASVGYQFKIQNNNLSLKLGAENIFNRYYSTFTDWNNIPRMGRNIYLNLSFEIK